MKTIPEFYQTHLQSQLSRAEYLLLTCLLHLLQTLKQVRLEVLATALPIPITFESRRRKLQRFLMLPQLSFRNLWFPILKRWLETEYNSQESLEVAIDRTQWGAINLLVVSWVVDRRAIPIYARLLDKLGSSNLEEQQKILEPVIALLENYKITVLGDREFCSVKLGNWLREQKVYFCLRLKRNEFVQQKDALWMELKDLGLVPGTSLYLAGTRVTKQQGFGTFNLAAKWQRKYRGKVAEEGWFILTNLETLEAAIQAYKKRFNIEEMFRDWKLGGYHLEGTGVKDDRLLSLLVLLTLAYSWATIEGKQIKRRGVQVYVGRVQEPGRSQRRHSSFYIGLYAQTWVDFWGDCQDIRAELMQLNRNKRPYYQKGLRAMKLILSAS